MSDDTTGASSDAVPAGGPEHDAWLREALRHAPDATAAPPILLREAIFAEARAATRPVPRNAPTSSLADRFAAIWSWLARPPVAAGFASVMAATLVGLMWWDRPMDEALPQGLAPVVATAMPKAEADSQASMSAAPASLAGPVTAAQSTTTPAATPPAPAATADRAQRRAVAAPQAAPAERAVALPAKSAPAADALREESKDAAKTRSNAAPAAPDGPAPPAPSPFPMRDLRDNDARAVPGRAEPAALAKKADKSDGEEKKEVAASESRLAAATPAPVVAAPTGALGRSTGASTDASATGRLAAQAQPMAAPRQRAAEATATARPMAPMLAALSSEIGRWSRPNPAGENAAIDGAVQAWLARVDASETQWQPLVDSLSRLDSALASAPEANTLLLRRDGRPTAIVRIEDGGVVFEPRPGQAWFAPLAPDAVARLRATLPAATR